MCRKSTVYKSCIQKRQFMTRFGNVILLSIHNPIPSMVLGKDNLKIIGICLLCKLVWKPPLTPLHTKQTLKIFLSSPRSAAVIYLESH